MTRRFLPGKVRHHAWRIRICTLTIIFTVGIPLSLSAEKMFLHRFSAEEPNPRLEHSLYLAAGVELVELGFSSSREAEEWDFLLQTDYSAGGDQVSVFYRLYESGRFRKKRAELEFRVGVNYDLDEEVAEAIRQLLKLAEIEPVPSPDAAIEGLFSPADEKPIPGLGEGADDYRSQGLQRGERSGDAAAPGDAFVLFDTSLSMAGLMFFGEVTEYFHYGAGGSLSGGFKRVRPSRSLFLGVKTSLFRVFNDRDVAGGPLYVSTAGPALRFGRGWKAGIPLSVGLSGGAAFIMLAEPEEMLTKTVPYGDLEFQAVLPFGNRMNAGAGISFLVMFEGDVLIMGASPSLSFGMEW